ncbi:MAG TPA: HAD family phosphatase [Acidobacteriaceae bacterium]|nr:HAD family phosphatase [Acidobacteriaceae bacterium]
MVDESTIKISAVLFDYGMVLSGVPEEQHWRQLEQVLSAEQAEFQAAYWKYRDAYDRGALSAQTYWESVARDLDKPMDAEVLRALVNADTAIWTQPNVEMMEWAARLNQAGIKTGILSNIGDAMEVGVLGRFPALGEFTHHTFSHRLGIAKPDAAIYRHAVEGLSVPAGEILFVDDRGENIAAARAAGMVGVQYLGHGGFVEEMRRMGLGWLLDV